MQTFQQLTEIIGQTLTETLCKYLAIFGVVTLFITVLFCIWCLVSILKDLGVRFRSEKHFFF